MLCSAQTGKPGPNWLDRLRSSKGFPADDCLDLDHFLLQSSSTPTPIILAKPVQPDPDRTEPEDDKENTGLYIVTNVLAELFNFEVKHPISNRTKQKKSSRKQKKPRICIPNSEEKCSNNGNGDGNFVNFQDEKGNTNNFGIEKGNQNNEKDGGDLVGFSRTEVTVIDTSFEKWKFDKVLYRRKNVWKVRDKKGKPKDAGRKRRKEIVNNDNEEKSNKKLKVSSSGNENDKRDDASQQTPEILGPISKKRSSFFRKSRQDTFSVLSVKGDRKAKEIVLETNGHHSKCQAKPSSCIKEKSQTLIDQ